jgi:putative ABC transport system ATP-binding protein
MAAPTARIEVSALLIERAGRRLLDGADLRVEAGAIAVVEGASGSGKTTLLKAIATLIAVDGGRVLLDGVDAAVIAPTVFRRRVAYVPQQPPMLAGSVTDNLATGPRLRGGELGEAAAGALLERVGLPASFGSREARDLSGGERQRVALARALANEPLALLLDEPTAALDPASAARVLDLVVALANDGLGVVVVTHVEEHAERLGGERWVCRAGRVERRTGAP